MSNSIDLENIHCHPNPETRTAVSALLIDLSRSSVRQRKLWRLSYFQPSTATCFHLQTNTVSDPDTTTSALLQLTSDIAIGFNQRKLPHRTVCVAVDLTAAFDTVYHNVLLSKIVRSTLPEATCRWLSNYLRGRQSITSCRGVKSKARIVHTSVPQGSKMSPTLFSFYLADMPRPTEPVKRICYADDITIWASGVKLPELEHKINDYPTEMSRFLRDNLLLISAPKSTVFAIQSCWECI